MAGSRWLREGTIDRARERMIAAYCKLNPDVEERTVRNVVQFATTDLLHLLFEANDMFERGDFDATDHQRTRLRGFQARVREIKVVGAAGSGGHVTLPAGPEYQEPSTKAETT